MEPLCYVTVQIMYNSLFNNLLYRPYLLIVLIAHFLLVNFEFYIFEIVLFVQKEREFEFVCNMLEAVQC